MTLLGVDLIVWAMSFAFCAGLLFQKETQKVARIMLKNDRIRKEIREKMGKTRALGHRSQIQLPPAYREENWMRNVYGEPSNENAILASTGCELTDAIYAAAHRAGIDIVEFEKENNHGYK